MDRVMSESEKSYTGADNLEVMKLAENYNAYLFALLQRIAPLPDGAFLDFGAGVGTYAEMLFAKGHAVTCLEPDATLRTRLIGNGFNVVSSLAEVTPESLDAVYSLNVLEHVEDDAAVAKGICQVLKPGAPCLIYVPAMQVLFSSMDEKVEHYRRYSLKGLIDLMHNAGFEIEAAAYADSLGFFATLLYKWFGRDDGSINPRLLKVYDRFVFPVSRALDMVCMRWFGKNVYVIARKSASE